MDIENDYFDKDRLVEDTVDEMIKEYGDEIEDEDEDVKMTLYVTIISGQLT